MKFFSKKSIVKKSIALLSEDPSLQKKIYLWDNSKYSYDELIDKMNSLQKILDANSTHQYYINMYYHEKYERVALAFFKKGIWKKFFCKNGKFAPFAEYKDIDHIISEEEFIGKLKRIVNKDLEIWSD